MKPAKKIEKLISKINVTPDAQKDKKTLDDILNAQEKTKTISSANTQPNTWRIIMNNKMTKFAAAVIVLVGMVIVHQFGGSIDGASVAWADVVDNIERIRTSTFRTTTSIEGLSYVKGGAPQETDGLAYYSSNYGMRMDTYENGALIRVEHWIPEERLIVTINNQMKTFSHRFFTEEEFRNKFKKREPKEFIKHIMSFEYTELGRETIDGVEVEGVEVTDPKVMPESMVETVAVCLWVDVETNLPVRIEMKGTAANGSIKIEQVLDVLELDGEVEATVFEPDIPGDYTLFSEAEINDKSEGIAVEGLRIFAEITDGLYPSSLAILTAVNEVWQARSGKKISKEEVERGITIQSTCSFYAALDQADKDVAYYGDMVTANDVDKVLMRWKISDDKYRVIFGDLTTENVTVEDLAEIERLTLE